MGPYVSDSTAHLSVPPGPASSHMSADAAIPQATPSSAAQEVPLGRTRLASGIRAQALVNTTRDKVHLHARNKSPTVSAPIDVNVLAP